MEHKQTRKIILVAIAMIIIWFILSVTVRAETSSMLRWQTRGVEAEFLGNSTVKKNNIEKVTIKNSMEGINKTAWDVTINGSGSIKAWYTDEDGDGLYEVTIGSNTGKVVANTDSSYLFSCIGKNNKASIIGLENLDTSKVTNMESMFNGCTNITSLDLGSFDTSEVRYMQCMFKDCESLTNLNIKSFNTSRVVDMQSMFYNCNSIEDLDLSSFNTSEVRHMQHMFRSCSNLSKLDINEFDTNSLTNCNGMFAGCDNLALNTSQFNQENIEPILGETYYIDDFFERNGIKRSNIERLTIKNSIEEANETAWDVSEDGSERVLTWYTDEDNDGLYEVSIGSSTGRVVANPDSSGLFCDIGKDTEAIIEGLENLDTSKVIYMDIMFEGCKNLKVDLSNLDVSEARSMDGMFNGCSGLANINLSNFNTSEVLNMYGMFSGCSSLTDLDLSSFDTSNVSYMDEMFLGCNSLVNLNIRSFDTSKVLYMTDMFTGCSNITDLDLYNFNTDNVIYMNEMFSGCTNLTELNIGRFNTSNVIDMNCMFKECESLINLDLSSFNTSKVINMNQMFYKCRKLENLDVSSFDTINVTDMRHMFYECSNLKNIDVSNFDTSKVTNVRSMFYGCTSLTNLDISGFDTSNVTDMGWMFCNCSNIDGLDVSNFDTSKVTNMKSMFNGCARLTNLDVSGFNTSNVTDMGWMFCNCSNIDGLDVSNFDTSKVTNMKTMFYNCRNLTSLDVSSFDVSNVTDMSFMFSESNGLSIINLTSFKTKEDALIAKMFRLCKDDLAVVIPKDMIINANSIFEDCNNPTIICDKNSSAETFAKNNNVKYVTKPEIEEIQNGVKYTNTVFPTVKYAEICDAKLYMGEKEIKGYQLGNEIQTNGNYTIKAKYPVGEETVVNFSVNLPVSISYSTIEDTNKDVVVTITANKEMQEIDGWTLSKDKKKLTKKYNKNTNEKVTVTDIAGNVSVLEINVSNIDKTMPEIEGVKEGRTYYKEATVKAKDNNLKSVELYKDGSKITTYKNGDKLITKGSYKIIAKDSAGNEAVVNFAIVDYLAGDVNGDGKVSVTDLVLIKRYIVKLIDLTEEQKTRGDINGDEKVTVTDLIKVKRIITKLD